ncbi:MAG TPA: lactate utilization protein C [Pseudogracilibacillus sp.]|nr:lactate utilization protein C [Pseudogracilibacillus sp.]
MTIQNRDSFIENIAKALNRPAQIKSVDKPNWDYHPQKDVFKNYQLEDLVDIFQAQCENVHTDFKRTDLAQLNQLLKEVIENYQAKNIITSNDSRHDTFQLSSLFDELQSTGTNVHYWDVKLGKENQVIAETSDIGITYSDLTLAESATICQYNDKNNGRTISLLPQNYLAIIPKSTLVPRLTQAMTRIHQDVANGKQVPSCLSFISGPSNSADIEMNLVVGVHGPVKASYILVDDM